MYVLNITKKEKNPEWKPNMYHTGYGTPPLEYNEEQVLSVALTEGEFNAVKIAVLEYMKRDPN